MSEGCCYSMGNDGVLLRVKARTGAPRDALGPVRGSELTVDVRAAPEKGKANAAIVKVLAGALGVPRDVVTLRRGASSHHKVFLLPAACARPLAALCAGEKEK